MRWSNAHQAIAAKLHFIEEARRSAAQAQLIEATGEAATARQSNTVAQSALDEAARDWSSYLSSNTFDPHVGKVFAGHLLNREGELKKREDEAGEAERRVEEKRGEWQARQSAVRSGEVILRRGLSRLAKRTGRAADEELSDRTSWKWFCR
jgi:hypothetical protein